MTPTTLQNLLTGSRLPMQRNNVTCFSEEAMIKQNIHSYYQLARMVVSKVNEVPKKKTNVILVADDEPLTFQLIDEFLTEANLQCKILTALDGERAYELAIAHLPDLVITDWLMPRVDGLSLIKQLKKNPLTSEIPIIMATGVMASAEEFNKILEAGAIDCLKKPLDYTELKARVKTALALSESLKEIKQNKESMHNKNQFLNFLIDTAPNAVFYQGKDGRFIGCNSNFEELINRTKLEIIGRKAEEFLPASFANALASRLQSLNGNGQVQKIEIEIHDNEIGTKHFLLSYVGIGSSSEEVTACSITDITEVIESGQEALKQIQQIHKIEKDQFANSVEKLQTELDFKHRELTVHLELLIHSRNVKEKLLEGINKLQPFLTLDGKSKLLSLLRQLQWELNEEIELSMEKKFDELHLGLYGTLEKKCSEVTKNEKRLCAYLLMNHSASDIAKITDKSLNSVNVGFARLRTKLGLPNNKDLRNFLVELSPTHGLAY